jgi:hypothetical protein
MKIKLAALLAALLLGLAGCNNTGGGNGNANNSNTGTRNASNTSNSTSSTTSNKDEGMVKANADPTDKTGGTKEGCKCSAAGMACNGKDGCCGKDGCSTMKDGKSSCCSKEGSTEAACCSTAGKSASNAESMPGGCNTEKKAGAPPAKKS